jgi:hypothetical protein
MGAQPGMLLRDIPLDLMLIKYHELLQEISLKQASGIQQPASSSITSHKNR